MKKILLILLILSVLLVGCEFPDKMFCIEHNKMTIERTGQRTWDIQEGTIKIKIFNCDEDINMTTDILTNITNQTE